ncbi:TPA: hypothetical protein ACXDU7_003616 [Clostridioides difficile]
MLKVNTISRDNDSTKMLNNIMKPVDKMVSKIGYKIGWKIH